MTPYGVSQRFALPPAPPCPLNDPPLLLFPGAPIKRKNLELVLTAMAEAPEGTRLRAARLEISGARSESFPHYRRVIEASGLGGRVDWLGQVPSDEMPKLLAHADVVVYPSLYEGFGFPPLEAMLAGTPVVASNAACLPEVLDGGAILVHPNETKQFIDAVEALLVRAELRSELVEKGRAQAVRYTWKRCADLTVEVYRDVISAGR